MDEVATVERWHHLLNSGDLEGLMALVDPDVEVGGPRGTGRGAQLVREWFGRAGVQLVPRRVFHRDGVVVVEEEGMWSAPGGDQAAGSQVVWSLFAVREGAITRIVRFDQLSAALAAAGIGESDEVTQAGQS